MTKTGFAKKKNGLPVVSKADIENITERMLADFCPETLQVPQAIKIDSFAVKYLGMKQEYQYLSHNGIYLGMTVFNDSDEVPIFDAAKGRAEFISVKAGTMLIDRGLLKKPLHRYRFTVAHEAGHGFFHTEYFAQKIGMAAARSKEDKAFIQCRIENIQTPAFESEWTDNDWLEWQANSFASCLLMPRKAVLGLKGINNTKKDELWASGMILTASKTFDVSLQAADIRLRDLGIISGFSKADINCGMSFYANTGSVN